MSLKDDVLIIEDSPAICMLLKNYLEKLAYTKIHTCTNGSTAIETFKDLTSMQKNPIILLDYMLPDMDARSILTQILEIQPNARVILATATEKDDEGIKDLIRLGAYQYLEKPIHFENLKSTIEIIEQEQSFFTKESEQVKMLKASIKDDQIKLYEHMDFLLKSTKQISLNSIKQLIGSSNDSVTLHLNELEQQGKIISLGDKKEIACNQCDSVKITQTFYCPSCKSSNFRLGKLIEHYDCGNISEENTYTNDMCPSCNKEIQALGVDYRVMQNHYICNNCKGFFSEISTDYLCLKCENKFKLDECRWKSSPNYKAINM